MVVTPDNDPRFGSPPSTSDHPGECPCNACHEAGGLVLANDGYELEVPGRLDPTSTTTVQRKYARFLRGRIEDLNADVRELVQEADVLGLGDDSDGAWSDLSAAQTARAFDDWFQDAVERDVLEPHDSDRVRQWFERTSQQAIQTANGELREFDVDVDPVDDVLAQDAVQEEIEFGMEDARQRVESWMDDYATDARTLVTAGLGAGVAKSVLARDIIERGQVYKSHCTATASGRIVNQYNTLKLTSYERVDPEIELDVEAEYQTAEDDRVCELCQSLSGTYSLEEAQQIAIPDDTHNYCRCQWVVTDVRDLF